jgi:hypothetical protein
MNPVKWLLDKWLGKYDNSEGRAPTLEVDTTPATDYAGIDAWASDQERRLTELRAALDAETQPMRRGRERR